MLAPDSCPNWPDWCRIPRDTQEPLLPALATDPTRFDKEDPKNSASRRVRSWVGRWVRVRPPRSRVVGVRRQRAAAARPARSPNVSRARSRNSAAAGA